MRKLMTTAAIATFIAGAAIVATSFEIKTQQYEADSLLACLWFPVCKDPDFHQPHPIEPEASVGDILEKDSMYACLWFPVCKDPDMPVFAEQSEAAIA
ncbi:hypothetical protein [Alkalimonas amylolytica]|uniref:Uncharacterized protein n=1 Tax=Alkalimonas amylolytica TaxID=152573 RepID=A0A1H3XET0_ALKAM|nr:hypothetical protein [Alkalimonas amylolytica]SDZ97843.1 hypothetical protein SAMN04488051_101216 [Alkalimonas amylolytica]